MLLLQRSSLRHRIDFVEHLGISRRCTGSQGLRFCPFRNAATTQNLYCIEWKWVWVILPLIWDIGYVHIYYINISIYTIYTYIYMILKSIIKPHFVFNVFHKTYVSPLFSSFELRFSSWMAWRGVHSRVSGTSIVVFADRRPKQAINRWSP